jgi:hypothetical protein
MHSQSRNSKMGAVGMNGCNVLILNIIKLTGTVFVEEMSIFGKKFSREGCRAFSLQQFDPFP